MIINFRGYMKPEKAIARVRGTIVIVCITSFIIASFTKCERADKPVYSVYAVNDWQKPDAWFPVPIPLPPDIVPHPYPIDPPTKEEEKMS